MRLDNSPLRRESRTLSALPRRSNGLLLAKLCRQAIQPSRNSLCLFPSGVRRKNQNAVANRLFNRRRGQPTAFGESAVNGQMPISKAVRHVFQQACAAPIVLNPESKSSRRLHHFGLSHIDFVQKRRSRNRKANWRAPINRNHLKPSGLAGIHADIKAKSAVFLLFPLGSAASEKQGDRNQQSRARAKREKNFPLLPAKSPCPTG